ncbi:MAG: response regulator [Anaerolineae bacterium]|nr:response regulator [Anaerolineae bacterium]
MAGEMVLVVDDGQENRDFVVDYVLRPNGYRASVARDGQEGLEKALTESPDLILLDYQMPRMDGGEVMQALREKQCSIPVILMTFHGSEEVAVLVFRLGVRDYIRKPFSVDEMLEAIERALMETRLRRERDELTQRLLTSNRDMQRRIKELNALYSIGKSVTSLLNIRQLLTRIVDAAVYVTGADQGRLMMVHEGALYTRAVRLKNDAGARTVNERATSRAAYRVLSLGKTVMLNPNELAVAGEGEGESQAVLYTPLKVGSEIVGVLGVDNLDPTSTFTDHDGTLLGALGDYAAVAIQNARLYSQLEAAKDREKQQLRGGLEQCEGASEAPPALSKTGGLEPGGKRQVVSVLFADIRGYTAFSEQMPPEKVVECLNEYFTLACDIVAARGGTLDKFTGDAIMAFFNAPQPQPDHILRAVDAGLALQRAAAERSAKADPNAALTFGVGIAVGEAVVGNIGAKQWANYTAVGDTVDLAKRLQEQASPGQILIDERIARALGQRVRVEPLGTMRLKGRRTQANVYALKGLVVPRGQTARISPPQQEPQQN